VSKANDDINIAQSIVTFIYYIPIQSLMIWLSIIIAFIALVIGSITDIQKREVHDYVSYGLMFISLGISIIYSIVFWDFTVVIQSIMGFIIGLGIAFAMFYMGQWGGGDSKLLMGLGAVFGFNVFPLFGQNNLWLAAFMIMLLFVGAFYGLIWSIYLAIRNRKRFWSRLKEVTSKGQMVKFRIVLLIFTILSIIITFALIPREWRLLAITLLAIIYVTFYLWVYIKVVEEVCMVKNIPVSKLTEGDWIYKNIYVNKKLIAGPKDLGISREQIAMLKKYSKQKKIKGVTIKEGIPFIPAFLIAYVLVILAYYGYMHGLFRPIIGLF
jgi:Flp pilus assembly protein protease CpaA